MAQHFKICPACEKTRPAATKDLVCYCDEGRYGRNKRYGEPLKRVNSWQKRDGTIIVLGSSGQFIEHKKTPSN